VAALATNIYFYSTDCPWDGGNTDRLVKQREVRGRGVFSLMLVESSKVKTQQSNKPNEVKLSK